VVLRGLRDYIGKIAAAIGSHGESYCIETEPTLEVYLALDGRIPGLPARDVALLWDERNGWAGAIETGCGEELIIVSYLGVSLVPKPEVVANYVARLLDGKAPGQADPPGFRKPYSSDRSLRQTLRRYATPALANPH